MKVFSGYYINIDDPCYHKVVYVLGNTKEECIELLSQINVENFELLKKSINYLCDFNELEDFEKKLFQNSRVHIFDAEHC